jgi:hypothetical protein
VVMIEYKESIEGIKASDLEGFFSEWTNHP